ncbi:hypothetical protein [Mesorhizobium sp. SP-1A]|uniref:hypothetical protein n=1 Tax=Mesorhizobium sp. SP-1A TaxID=3077840 RepID=UPI0028F7480A|nr:hypothetical protein [Mesorhizobium sp. SP-1A]
MKNLILAAAIAVAGAMAVGMPAQAAITVTTVTKTVHRPGYDRPAPQNAALLGEDGEAASSPPCCGQEDQDLPLTAAAVR